MKTATIIDLIVDANVHTQSMNHIIKQQHISQRMRRRLKNDGIITINGQPATWDTLVHGGDHLLMKLAPEQEFSRTPMNLEVVYEDEHILAVNKAAGVLMHPTSQYAREHWQMVFSIIMTKPNKLMTFTPSIASIRTHRASSSSLKHR